MPFGATAVTLVPLWWFCGHSEVTEVTVVVTLVLWCGLWPLWCALSLRPPWSLEVTVVVLWFLWCHCGHFGATLMVLWSLRGHCGHSEVTVGLRLFLCLHLGAIVTVVLLWPPWCALSLRPPWCALLLRPPWSLEVTVVVLWSLWCHCGHFGATLMVLWSL